MCHYGDEVLVGEEEGEGSVQGVRKTLMLGRDAAVEGYVGGMARRRRVRMMTNKGPRPRVGSY